MAKLPARRATAPAPATEPEAADDNGITSVHVSRNFKIGMADFSSISFQVGVTAGDYETASAMVDDLMAQEAEKANAQFAELTGREPGDEGGLGESGEGAVEEDGSGEGQAEEGQLSAEDVNAMKRDELEQLVTENELPIDPADHPKTAKGLASLKAAIIEAAFTEDGEAGEEEAEEAGAEDEITEEAINAMDRPTLVKFINSNGIEGIDIKKLTKLSDLKKAVIAALSVEDDGAGEEAAEEAAEDGGEEAATYTEADFAEYGLEDLKGIWTDWGVPGKFPPGPEKMAKPLAIKKLIAFQSTAG